MFEDLITDRTLEDVQNRTAKGHYNASDLNRVEHAVKEISELLTKEAYPVVYQPHIGIYQYAEDDINSKIIIHNGDMIDSSIYNQSIQNKGIVKNNSVQKFTDGSLEFNSTNKAYAIIPADGLTDEFTIEFWIYPKNTLNENNAKLLSTHSYNVTGGISVESKGNSTTNYNFYYTGHWNDSERINFSITMGKWTHLAFVQKNRTMTVYVGGKKQPVVKSQYEDLNFSEILLGAGKTEEADSQKYYNGYMDDIRISNIARYTEDFTVPSEPFSPQIIYFEQGEKDWTEPENYDGIPDHPTESEMNRYLHNLSELKRQFYQQKDTPRLPVTMSRLKHTTANNIEQFVKDTGSAYEEMKKMSRPCGTFKAGEILP